jgi:pentatricopeptide repeat protein
MNEGGTPTLSLLSRPAIMGKLIHPDEISFNTIIKGCAMEKRLNKAFEMFELMK